TRQDPQHRGLLPRRRLAVARGHHGGDPHQPFAVERAKHVPGAPLPVQQPHESVGQQRFEPRLRGAEHAQVQRVVAHARGQQARGTGEQGRRKGGDLEGAGGVHHDHTRPVPSAEPARAPPGTPRHPGAPTARAAVQCAPGPARADQPGGGGAGVGVVPASSSPAPVSSPVAPSRSSIPPASSPSGGTGSRAGASTRDTRQIVFDRSSATISAPRGSTVTPTGRPRVVPSSSRKPVTKSTGSPAGRPLRNGTNTTL